MNTFTWIVVCLFAGWLTSRIMINQGIGIRFGSFIGIAGALVAGLLAAYLLNIANAARGINLSSILVSFLGAGLAIWALRLIVPRFRQAH